MDDPARDRAARGAGVTIDELAALCDVTTRTIRRDLQALEEAGFPLFDDKARDDGKTRWLVNGQAFKGLSAGLTVSELCALYFTGTLLESLSGYARFRDDVESAFEKAVLGADAAHAAVPRSASARSSRPRATRRAGRTIRSSSA
jgi:predicted DNA-binding transcriptional regulator YafY